ncbi:protein D1-like isoform X2 [Leptopilina heterotoma]|uniref:protein D1-like isoform X2 n=1 Tax=Leptopilina heterotoma TaxID=63436 RepID=UPI001CA7F7E1|nr:protein D1-like isoform X2 [Leptopilina heterotoma]
MKYLITGFLLFGVTLVAGDVKSKFEDAKIVSDILDSTPTELIEVKYGNITVDLGNELTPTETKNIPYIDYKHEGGLLYTLSMTDLDAPVRGYNREWQHWLVGNIPENKVAKGEVLTEYFGPAPPKNANPHRYVFLLFKQNQGAITFDERRLSNRDKMRSRFSIKKFAQKYNLEGPIAGNFMRAKYDDYVPTALKQLGIIIRLTIKK